MDSAAMPLPFTSRRSPCVCAHGCIATSQPLASEIGLRILRQGGNAADACVAAAAALNCTEPCQCGIGGDAFCLYYDAKTRRVRGLNGSGRAPAALDLPTARATGGPAGGPAKGNALDPASVHCCTVPGAAAAWCDTVERFGRLPLADVLAPAIALAEGGFPVNVIAAHVWAEEEHQLTSRWGPDWRTKGNPGAVALLKEDGRAPAAGEWMVMPELARTFRALAEAGKSGFYEGRIAKAVVDTLRAHGGTMSEADLAAHTSTFDEPISARFRGKTVYELPPNGSGLIALLALRLLEQLPEPAAGSDAAAHNTAPYLHRIIEALKLAFADGTAAVCDPAARAEAGLPPLPLDELLGDAYTHARAALIDEARAAEEAVPGGALAASLLFRAASFAAKNGRFRVERNKPVCGREAVVPTAWARPSPT
jgi:gamma-glutamyltranspeptidase/glutathione hydrolase